MSAANDLKTGSGVAWFAGLRRWPATIVASLATLVRKPRIHPQRRFLWPLGKMAIVVAIVAVVFVLGLIFTDAAAIIYARTLPRGLIDFFDWITDFGKSGWFLWPLGILFLILAALPPLTRVSQQVLAAVMVRVGFLFVAIAIPGLFVTTVKQMIGRARPFVPGIADPYVFKPFTGGAAYASMPSGHATTAFSVLIAIGTLWPRSRPILIIYAALILISRIVVTAHHPTDVLGGAIVGAVGALMVRRYFALRRLGLSVGPDGAIHPYPGPSFKRIKSVARELLA